MSRHLALIAGLTLAAGNAFAAGGTIKGSVKLSGKPPAPKEVNMKADPFCAKAGPRKDEEVVVGASGGLKNVAVHVVKGAPAGGAAPSEPAVLDQSGCMYTPRVLMAQAGQTVQIKNSDQTLHNVHTYKGTVSLFNQAQVMGMPAITKKTGPSTQFASGDVVKFKCDVHPWMTGYVLVTDNPYFAVSGDDGSFTIANVPAGTYTLEAWHEKLGTKTVQVTVADGKTADAKFDFTAK
jgi:plastocyanin